jgi:hypothetical protein
LDHSPTLPNLSQGQLIDKNYVAANGLVAPELDFVLAQDPGDPNNDLNHRDMENTVDLRLALDNSNTAGVEGGSGAVTSGNPQDVLTGIELSIPLDQLLDFMNAIPSGDIRVLAFVNGNGHNFVSNQFSGEGVLQGNYGNLPPDLETEAAGNQFVTVPNPAVAAAGAIPEPSSALLISFALAAGAAALRGR